MALLFVCHGSLWVTVECIPCLLVITWRRWCWHWPGKRSGIRSFSPGLQYQ
ncbi:hypothetical protein [Edaphovirga cremea]|uniref:hypothetical protein n=1 Tax=Edaphovirga cremea TaxID=2267246 RepID=UPI00398A44E6